MDSFPAELGEYRGLQQPVTQFLGITPRLANQFDALKVWAQSVGSSPWVLGSLLLFDSAPQVERNCLTLSNNFPLSEWWVFSTVNQPPRMQFFRAPTGRQPPDAPFRFSADSQRHRSNPRLPHSRLNQ